MIFENHPTNERAWYYEDQDQKNIYQVIPGADYDVTMVDVIARIYTEKMAAWVNERKWKKSWFLGNT